MRPGHRGEPERDTDHVDDPGNINAVRVRGHGLGSDTPFEESVWQVGEWRAGKTMSWNSNGSETETLDAAGLTE